MAMRSPMPRMMTMTEVEYDAWSLLHDVRSEYVDGRVVILSPESEVDEDLRWFLGHLIGLFVERHRLGRLYGPNFQARLRTGLRRLPDLMFVSDARVASIVENHLEGGPDLAVELVSAGSEHRDRAEKFREYRAAGVGEYWLIQADARRLDAYQLVDGGYVPVRVEDGVFRSRVLPGFWLRVEWLWRGTRPDVFDALRALGVID